MDWSKVKNILIILFIALNIFLLVNIIDISTNDVVSKKTLNNTVKILNNNGVTVECKIPTYSQPTGTPEYTENVLNRGVILGKLLGNISLPSLDVTQDGNTIESSSKWIRFDGNSFEYGNSNPTESIDINSLDDILQCVRNLLKDTGIPFERFVPDYPKLMPSSDSDVLVALRERSDNYILFDNSIKIIASKDGIVSLVLSYRKLIDITQPRSITPVYQILIKNFHNRSGTVITSIDFGFKMIKLDNETNSFVDVPVWRIMSSEGITEFYRADNGEPID